MKKSNDSKINISRRIEKGIEIKKSLIKLEINEEICPDLKNFFSILNDWVRDGDYRNGKIFLPEIDRQIVYTLSSPKYTTVVLRVK